MNYYKVVQRGAWYRVGRHRWWGWQWWHEGGECTFETRSPDEAKKCADKINTSIDLWAKYKRDDWKVVS